MMNKKWSALEYQMQAIMLKKNEIECRRKVLFKQKINSIEEINYKYENQDKTIIIQQSIMNEINKYQAVRNIKMINKNSVDLK